MSEFTENYGLQKLGPGEPLSTNDYKALDADRDTIDQLLKLGAETHHHTGAAAVDPGFEVGARTLTLVPGTTTGAIPAGVRVHYRFTIVVDGFESNVSDTFYVDTPAPVAAPGTLDLATASTGGSLLPGNYYYVLTAYAGTNTEETRGVSPTYILIPSGTATNTVTITLPELPDGADGFNVYRKKPGGVRYDYVASIDMSLATPPTTFLDDGSIEEDCNRTTPAQNFTNTRNHIVVQLDGDALDVGDTWNLYRTYVEDQYNDSRIASAIADDEFDDLGASGSGSPPIAGLLVSSPSKVLLTGGAEVQGLLPASMIDGGTKGGGRLLIVGFNSPAEMFLRADFECDGENDEVQIQAAIDEIESWTVPAGTIEFASGTYNIAAPITKTGGSYINLIGAAGPGWEPGEGSVLARYGVDDFSIFDFSAVSGRVQIFDLTIMDVADDLNGDPIMLGGGADFTLYVERCKIQNWQSNPAWAIQWAGQGRLTTRECYIEGLLCTDTASTSHHVKLYDTELYGAPNAIEWSCGGGTSFEFHNINIDGTVRIDGNISNTPLPEVTIDGGDISGDVESIYLTDIASLWVDGIRISSGGSGSAIRLSNVDKGHVKDCHIGLFTNGLHGIILTDCDYVDIEGNAVTSLNSQTTDATYSGIILDGDTNNCRVEGNTVRTAGANQWLYGIRVDDSTCDNNTIINNDLRTGSKTAGNEFSDAGTGTVAGLESTALMGWWQDNVTASQTAVVLALSNGRTEIPMPADGYVVGVAVYSNAARTTGTLTVDPTINGTATGLTAVLDGSNTQTKTTRQSNSADRFTVGQRVGVKITTDGTWAPTTADIDVSVLVVFNTANRV